MATGKRPFVGETQASVISAILRDTPSAVSEINPALPVGLSSIVQRCLQKDPEKRYPGAGEVCNELKALEASLAPARPTRLSRKVWMAIAAALVVAVSVAGWLWHSASRSRFTLDATPEVARLVEQEQARLVAEGEFLKAAALAREGVTALPEDPTFKKLLEKSTWEASFETIPPGADVSLRPYTGDPNAWVSIGKTPLVKIRLAGGAYLFRYAKQGYVTRYEIGWPDGPEPLDQEGSIPADMERVPVYGGTITASLIGLQGLPKVPADNFLIDRTEVANEAYKRFVDAGGYEKRVYWKQPCVKDGRTISWEEAVALFRDRTGRPGPATWEAGSFPTGLEKHPVAGVSWYEAAAYAEFAGKSLPTVYHWAEAAGVFWAHLIVAGSNFRGVETVPVGGEGTLGTWGTYDMAGNVKEWCWNEGPAGKRFILGGGYGEPPDMFIQTDAQSPWDRRPNYGFRCAKVASPPPPEAMARLEPLIRDISKEKPVSDEVFGAYKGLYAYDKAELNAKVEETGTTANDFPWEKVTFNAAYGGERMIAYLYQPRNVAPPFQTVVQFPAIQDEEMVSGRFDPSTMGPGGGPGYVPQSGRVLVMPIYKSTFERRDEWNPNRGVKTAQYRDHLIMWSKDLGRTLDYLETRKDIDSTKFAYLGQSGGAALAPILLAVDGRFKAAALTVGGFWLTHSLPEAEPLNFVTRVKTPTLMLNFRYDESFGLEASQLPFFRLLGTPDKDKKHVVFESGNAFFGPWKDTSRETLDWLDKYLGPVKR